MPRQKEKVKKEVAKVIAELAETIAREVEDSDGIRVPGKIVHGGKTPWTRRDVENKFPMVEFTPEETIPVTYNGVVYQLISDVTIKVPSCIRDIYVGHRRAMRRVDRHFPVNSKMEGVITVNPGMGAFES